MLPVSMVTSSRRRFRLCGLSCSWVLLLGAAFPLSAWALCGAFSALLRRFSVSVGSSPLCQLPGALWLLPCVSPVCGQDRAKRKPPCGGSREISRLYYNKRALSVRPLVPCFNANLLFFRPLFVRVGIGKNCLSFASAYTAFDACIIQFFSLGFACNYKATPAAKRATPYFFHFLFLFG